MTTNFKIFLLAFATASTISLTTTAQTQKNYVKTKGALQAYGNVLAGIRVQGVTINIQGINSQQEANIFYKRMGEDHPSTKLVKENVEKTYVMLKDNNNIN